MAPKTDTPERPDVEGIRKFIGEFARLGAGDLVSGRDVRILCDYILALEARAAVSPTERGRLRSDLDSCRAAYAHVCEAVVPGGGPGGAAAMAVMVGVLRKQRDDAREAEARCLEDIKVAEAYLSERTPGREGSTRFWLGSWSGDFRELVERLFAAGRASLRTPEAERDLKAMAALRKWAAEGMSASVLNETTTKWECCVDTNDYDFERDIGDRLLEYTDDPATAVLAALGDSDAE